MPDQDLNIERRRAWNSRFVLARLSPRRSIVIEKGPPSSAGAQRQGKGPWISTPIATVVAGPARHADMVNRYHELRVEEEANA